MAAVENVLHLLVGGRHGLAWPSSAEFVCTEKFASELSPSLFLCGTVQLKLYGRFTVELLRGLPGPTLCEIKSSKILHDWLALVGSKNDTTNLADDDCSRRMIH